MANLKNGIISYRPSVDVVGDMDSILAWCVENDSSINAILNSFLPAINYAITHQVIEDNKSGKRYVRADFGDILLRPNYYRDNRYEDNDNQVPTLD